MPTITRISEQKKNPNRCNIHLDHQFAFSLNLNVIASLRLRVGLVLSDEQIRQIEASEVRQGCFDRAMRYLAMRLHSRSELKRKLMRHEYGPRVVEGVLDDLERLDYVNDERFAKTRALGAMEHKHQGRRRVSMELRKAGVTQEVASKALDDVFAGADTVSAARELAKKQAKRLLKLDLHVARRRLIGMLQRRGFDYEEIKGVVDEVLGRESRGED